jgi:ADP-ribosylglycohydrolase
LLICDNFVSAVRSNILAGGDCNARALLIGSCLGARLGVEGIPMEWIEKVNGMDDILKNAIKIYASS